MKRLIVSGAVLLGWFSSMVTGCGSRSSDNDYLPDATAGDAGLPGSAGSFVLGGGAPAGGGASAAGEPAGGASGFGNFPGSAGNGSSGNGGSHFAGAGGSTGTAGSPVTAGAGGTSGDGLGGSGVGGSAVAGSSTSGGSSSGGSSSGGSATGGTMSTGGTAGSAGFAGTGGFGAAGSGGGNNASCPVTLPNNNSMCATAALQCNYTGRSCACRAAGNSLRWRCDGSGNACPGSEPTAATACTGTLQCPYPDGDQCNCGASASWNCFTAGCPVTKPAPSGSCGSVFGQCTYGTGAGSACVCVAGGWFCN